MARIYGRSPSNFNLIYADGVNLTSEPDSIGPMSSFAVWYASGRPEPGLSTGGGSTVSAGAARNTPLWSDAWPGVVVAAPSGDDPYKSNVVSSTWVLPAFSQKPGDPSSWQPDTGLLPQKVSVPGGSPSPAPPAAPVPSPAQATLATFSPPPGSAGASTQSAPPSLPIGTPVIVLPFSITTEQQMAAVPAITQLIAVWRGGGAEGYLGTLVYDVTPEGELDYQRRARDHSSWRVYRLPTDGLLPFGAQPPTLLGQTLAGRSKPGPSTPISSGLAWQCGYDVDNQPGLGMIVDRAFLATPTPGGGTLTGPVPGTTLGSTGEGSVTTGVNGQPVIVGTGQGLQGGPGQGSTVSPPSAGQATGTAPTTQSRGGPPPPTTQSSVVVLGVTSKFGFGPFSVGQVVDKHHLADTPDQEPVNCTHWNVLAPIDGDGFDAPAETAGAWIPPSSGGPLWVPVYWRYDEASTHPFVASTRPGLRRWETTAWFSPPPIIPKIPPSDPSKDPTSEPSKDPTNDPGYKPTGDPGAKTSPSDPAKPPSNDPGTKPPSSDPGQTKPAASDPGTRTKPPYADPTGKPPSAEYAGKPPIRDPGYDNITGSGPSKGAGGSTKDPNDEHFTKPPTIDPTTKAQVDAAGAVGFGTEASSFGQTAGVFTFGGQVLLASGTPQAKGETPPDTNGTISINRSYGRTPSEIAFPGILGRPARIFGTDTRGRTGGLTRAQQAAFDAPVPVSGVLAAVSDQSTGSFVWFPG